MGRSKLFFAFASLLAGVVSGYVLAGWLSLLSLELKDAPLTWHTYGDCFHALDLPQVASYAGKIKLAGYVGFGLPLLVWLIPLIPLFRSRPESLRGDAGFAGLPGLKNFRCQVNFPPRQWSNSPYDTNG